LIVNVKADPTTSVGEIELICGVAAGGAVTLTVSTPDWRL
jgi:hypothetical protein